MKEGALRGYPPCPLVPFRLLPRGNGGWIHCRLSFQGPPTV